MPDQVTPEQVSSLAVAALGVLGALFGLWRNTGTRTAPRDLLLQDITIREGVEGDARTVMDEVIHRDLQRLLSEQTGTRDGGGVVAGLFLIGVGFGVFNLGRVLGTWGLWTIGVVGVLLAIGGLAGLIDSIRKKERKPRA